MQQRKPFYDPELHEKFHALAVKQPYASYLLERIGFQWFVVQPEWRMNADTKGITCHRRLPMARKSIEVRSKNTKYRGDILVCASKKPDNIGLPSGCTVGFVELYDVKRVEDFTDKDWENTCIPPERRPDIKTGYGWMMRNPRKVIEFPVSSQLGIFDLYFTRDMIMTYPENIIYDPENLKL